MKIQLDTTATSPTVRVTFIGTRTECEKKMTEAYEYEVPLPGMYIQEELDARDGPSATLLSFSALKRRL